MSRQDPVHSRYTYFFSAGDSFSAFSRSLSIHTPMTTLHISLLGNFWMRCDDEPITPLLHARMQEFLAYLALHPPAPHSRQQLAFLFWPDSSEQAALTNLRVLLLRLRKAWPGCAHYLSTERSTVGWQADASIAVDVAQFEKTLDQAETGKVRIELSLLRQAIDLYTGDLLSGLYEEWILPERERLRTRYMQTLDRLIALLEQNRAYAEAIDYARQLLNYDPLREVTYRTLMRLHALNDERAEALRIYHTCVTTLEQELGVPPDRDTQQIYERLLHRAAGTTRQPQMAQRIPLVGRKKEWQCLLHEWGKASQGRPQMVLIWGEAGMGKTRLAEELVDTVQHLGLVVAQTRSYAAEGELAYAPVRSWLQNQALQTAIAELAEIWQVEVARLVPEILAQRPHLPQPGPLRESWQRQRFFEALAKSVAAAPQPLLLLLDDLQWCDQETLEWLHYLLRYDRQARLLLVGAARSEEVPTDHPLRALLRQLSVENLLVEFELNPLDATETAMLAAQVAEETLPKEVQRPLYLESEGHPLFLIEMVRMQQGGSVGIPGDGRAAIATPAPDAPPHPPDGSVLPPKIHAVITRRLAQLSHPARDLARLAAVVGRSFRYEVLQAASHLDESTLVQALDELWQRRIVREQDKDYDFSHDRIREVTYGEISSARRRLLHGQVAAALERVYVHNLHEFNGQIAEHYEKAGSPARALSFYQLAAEQALRLGANRSAIGYAQKGLKALAVYADRADALQHEYDLQMVLGLALTPVSGYTSPEVIQAYTRAYELAGQLGKTEQVTTILVGLRRYHYVGANFPQSMAYSERILALGNERTDRSLQFEGRRGIALCLFHTGQFKQAWEQLRFVVEADDLHQPPGVDLRAGAQEPGIDYLVHAGVTLWFLGYAERGRRISERVMAFVQSLSDPFSTAVALSKSTMILQYIGEIRLVQERIEEAIAISTRLGSEQWVAWQESKLGWALADQGQVDQGIALMASAYEAYVASGAEVRRQELLTYLAEAHAKADQIEDGMRIIDNALALTAHNGECSFYAETHRIKGRLLRQRGHAGDIAEAQSYITKALVIARRQQAKILELRAAMSLARLWQEEGDHQKAHDLLAPLYAWFTEGFDTPDLRAARAMLAELA